MSKMIDAVLATPIPFAEAPFLGVLGVGTWVIKLLGYYWFAVWLCRRYPEVEVSPAVFASFRAAVGATVGVAWAAFCGLGSGASGGPLANAPVTPEAAWYGGLIVSRLVEWVAMLWLFFGRHVGMGAWKRLAKHTAYGMWWSLATDGFAGLLLVPALIAGFAAA